MIVFPLSNNNVIAYKAATNIRVWEYPRPEPSPKNINDLSIRSGRMDPIISAKRLKSCLRLIYGISNTSKGTATWNIGKIDIPSRSNQTIIEIAE